MMTSILNSFNNSDARFSDLVKSFGERGAWLVIENAAAENMENVEKFKKSLSYFNEYKVGSSNHDRNKVIVSFCLELLAYLKGFNLMPPEKEGALISTSQISICVEILNLFGMTMISYHASDSKEYRNNLTRIVRDYMKVNKTKDKGTRTTSI